MSVGDNLTLTVLRRLCRCGFRSAVRERSLARRIAAQLGVRTAGLEAPARSLSGGNQQKIALGKWLAAEPRVLILDEPTRGVDVGAKGEIYRLLRDLARQGMATLLISSDMPELLLLSDRILVMCSGRLQGELRRGEVTQDRLLELALPAATDRTEVPFT
jgi:ribose transport system ATP-binding protein